MENSRRKIARSQISTSEGSQEESQEPKGCALTSGCGTTLQDLPSQLIMEILSRLPMKTLFSCREEVFNYLSTYGVVSKFRAIGHIPSFISLRDVAKAENLKLCRI